MAGKSRPLWLLQLLFGSVGLGFGLEWLGKKADFIAPWWAGSIVALLLLVVWGLEQAEQGRRGLGEMVIESRSESRRVADRLLGRVEDRLSGLEQLLTKLRADNEIFLDREKREDDRAWALEHKDELDAWPLEHQDEVNRLRHDIDSGDEEKSGRAVSRLVELHRTKPKPPQFSR